jgi:hypothetical protein
MLRTHKLIFGSSIGLLIIAGILAWPYLHIGPAPDLSFTFPTKESLIYRIHHQVQGRAKAKNLMNNVANNSWQEINAHFNATIDVTEIKQSTAGLELALDFYDVATKVLLDQKPQATAAANGLLATFANGFEKLIFPHNATFETRAQIRSVLALWQVVLPKTPAWIWEAEEDSPQGRFRTQYAIVRADRRKIEIKKSFVGGQINHNKNLPEVTKNGSFIITVDRASARITEIGGQVISQMQIGSELQGEEETTFSLSFVGIKPFNTAARDVIALLSEPKALALRASLLGNEQTRLKHYPQLFSRMRLIGHSMK